jgi:hypothetical protein
MKEKVGGKEGERTFSSSKGKLGKAEADNERTNHSRQTKRQLERIELEQAEKENVIISTYLAPIVA